MADASSVAAIIPTMNRAERLEGALESVFDQTYGDIEAVVVDGGSTDRTPDVVSAFQERYQDRVSYVRNEEPAGLPAARNRAVEETEAPLLAFLDDDDRWKPRKIERQVERVSGSDAGLCYTGLVSVTPDGDHVHTKRPTLEGDVYEDILVRNDIGTPSTVLVTREAFEDVGRFDAGLRYQEDWDLYIRIAGEYEIACVSDPLVRRLYHTEAMSRDVVAQKEYRERILERYADELRERGLVESARAVHHRDAGVMYCLNGDFHRGAQELRTALQYETAFRTWFLYLLTKAGPTGFGTVLKTKRKLNQAKRVLS